MLKLSLAAFALVAACAKLQVDVSPGAAATLPAPATTTVPAAEGSTTTEAPEPNATQADTTQAETTQAEATQAETTQADTTLPDTTLPVTSAPATTTTSTGATTQPPTTQPPTTLAGDTTAPAVTIGTSGNLDLHAARAAVLTLSGTASDDTAVTAVTVSLKSGGNCLGDGGTAFDAPCPHARAATGTAAWTFAVPIAALDTASSYEITATARDAAGNEHAATANFTWSNTAHLVLGVQDAGGGAFLQKVAYDVKTGAAAKTGTIALAPGIGAGALRGMARLADGSFLVGGADDQTTAVAPDGTKSAGPLLATGGSPAELVGIHGLCQLPDGSLIAGDYAGGPGGGVHQFAANGAYLRTVYTTTINSLTSCVAPASDHVFLIDYDADNDDDGDIVELTLAASSWSVAARYDASAHLGFHSSLYELALGADGDIWAPPQHAGGARNVKMIRCPAGDLAQCAPFGSDIPFAGHGFLQGVTLLPGLADLILVSDGVMYRYDATVGTTTSLFDNTTITGANQIRHVFAQ